MTEAKKDTTPHSTRRAVLAGASLALAAAGAAMAPAAAAAAPDGADAALIGLCAEFRRARATRDAVPSNLQDAYNGALAECWRISNQIESMPAHTEAGRAAKAGAALAVIEDCIGLDDDAASIRFAVTTLRDVAGIQAPTLAGTAHPDAELIRVCEQHVANLEAYLASDEGDRLFEDRLDAHSGPLCQAYHQTIDFISDAKPKTLAGILAKARVAKREAWGGPDGEESFGGTVAENWAPDIVNDLLRLFDEKKVA